MTQLSVMDLAKQGDPHAIAALINRSLASKGIHAEAELEFDCLTISLQAAQIPNQKAIVTIVHRGMLVLQVEQIKRVQILTYRSDNHYLAWHYEIDLGMELNIDASSESKQSLPMAQGPRDDQQKVMQGQNMNLVNNPKGVILVQKLSQIQRNLQEYQDIIVRFTDEQVGTVRCLTTLTELIQVISQPSFLFAAVASNPNLRSLLDTIAESSKTDEHGDQVITNLSILQPGQQWQKAKIRLVSKIFLEPAETVQDQDIPDVAHQGITLDLQEEDQHLESEIVDPQNPDHDSSMISSDASSESFAEDLATNSTPDSIVDNFTVNSLFDDFPEPTTPTLFQSEKLVNDITEISETSESLFDDSMNVASTSSDFGDKSSNNSYQSTNTNISTDSTSENQVEQNNSDDDLFGNFPSSITQAENPSKVSFPEMNTDIDSIKSRIPKQNLDKLLQLLDEEDQTKAETEAMNNNQKSSNLETITLESILSNMETITLSGLGSKSSSDFVTLDDFSKELDSVGF